MIRLFIAKTFLNCLVPVVMSVLKQFSRRKLQAVCVQDSQATNECVSLITEMIIRVRTYVKGAQHLHLHLFLGLCIVQTWPQFAKIYVIVHSHVYVVSNCMKIHTIRVIGINYPTHGRCQEFCKLKIRFSFFSIGYNGVNFRPEFAAEFFLLLCRLCILKSIITMPGKMI